VDRGRPVSGFEDVGLAVQADAAAVLRCPTCVSLRLAIELLIGTDDAPREAPEFVVMPLLIRWQQHKDQSHPALSSYLRRTTT
jgi:hypothetical protein